MMNLQMMMMTTMMIMIIIIIKTSEWLPGQVVFIHTLGYSPLIRHVFAISR